MRLQVRGISIPTTPAIKAHAERRVQSAAARLGSSVRSVAVRLSDLNGPRGGQDKLCVMEARLAGGGGVVRIEESGDDLYGVIDRAAGRLKQVLGRRVNRRADHRA